jgi:hypothetical protein
LFSWVILGILYFPEQILDSADLGDHRYYVTVGPDGEPCCLSYRVYRCTLNGLECEVINTEGMANVESVNLIVDEKRNEVLVIQDSYLGYSYLTYVDGAQPREILTSEQFGDSVYYIGVYPPYGPGSFRDQHTYTLYQCPVTFTSCQQLPFLYTDTGGAFKLTFDETTNTLSVYRKCRGGPMCPPVTQNDDSPNKKYDYVLIYSYRDEPRCCRAPYDSRYPQNSINAWGRHGGF